MCRALTGLPFWERPLAQPLVILIVPGALLLLSAPPRREAATLSRSPRTPPCKRCSLWAATTGMPPAPARTPAVSIAHDIKLPTYEEWSLAVEHTVVRNTTVALTYVGNHSYHQPVQRTPNEYGKMASLPTSRPNAALGAVTEFYSGSVSNYNGFQATVGSRLRWLTLQFNYAYGHALDTSSNGGFD